MSTVLVCDDEKDIVSALEIYLKSEGYNTVPVHSGLEAIECVKEKSIDLILLDIMMPGLDGITTLSKIREFSNVPVIFLSAKSEDTDKILGLNVGADDYVTKPFNPIELLARVKSQLRRYQQFGGEVKKEVTDSNIIRFKGIELNDNSKRVTLDGEEISLTKTEYKMLILFLNNRNQVLSPRRIYNEVWRDDIVVNDNTVAVHIRHLREKIEIDPANPRYIKVVWGHGYMMEDK